MGMSLSEIQHAIEALTPDEQATLTKWMAEREDPDDAAAGWRTLGEQAFAAAYAPEDEIYEQLLER